MGKSPRTDASASLFFATLDFEPARLHLSRVGCLGVAEYVRMPSSQLLDYASKDLVHGDRPVLHTQMDLEGQMKEHVAQLVYQLGPIVLVYRFEQLIALFEDVSLHRTGGLLPVPRAACRTPQMSDQA